MDTKSGEDFFLGKDPTGSRLSFVSATDVRYEGTLVQVSEEHGLIILSEVYCFGTENRKAQRYVENKGYLDILLVVSKGQVKRAEIVPEESEEEQDDDDEESLEADEDSGGDASSQTGTLEEEDCSQAPEQSLDLDAENDEKESGFVDSESVAGSTSAPIIPADETCDEPPMLYKQMLLKDAYSSQGSLNTLGQLPPRTWKVPMAMSKKKLKETLFPEYSIPEDLEELLRASPNLQYLDHLHLEEDVILDYLNWMFGEGLNEKNYKEFQSFYLYIEEMAMDEELTKFDMFSVEFSSEKLKKPQVKVDIPGMIDKCPNVIKGDLIHAHRHGQWYSLRVKETYQSKAILESVEFREEAFPNHRIKKAHADIQFTVNRCNLRSMHRSITLIKKEDIKRIFPPPEASHIKAWKSLLKPKDLSLFNKSLRSNQEQMQAVLHILQSSSHPYPYVLFGPPGTGKTVTVVEAIKQVWSRIKASRIIVAAPSNAAADLLTSRLVGDIPKSDILRLLSATREGIEIDSAIADVCVFGKIRVGRLMKYRIVIVTLATSSKLVNAQLELGHFSHLFIDEAGQSTETECLIPMAGLLASTGNVVLSGDPCQLGPVVTSKLAEKHGYAMSLLERLMTTQPLYMRDANGNREPKCITKLLRNFRSHSKLLTVPSEMFYDNELIPCADKNETESLCKMSWIPKQGFPIVFHGVRNLHEKEGPSHSLFNEKEVTIVLNYVHRLSKVVDQHSIGIVSPYRRQVRRIREQIDSKLGLPNIGVGSTEEFQGQERKVIIISTVRSSLAGRDGKPGGGLGFLVNPKRFNVAVTRAKALLIIVGDPFLLQKNKYWNKILKYAHTNGGYTGVSFSMGKNYPARSR